jgi:multiple sugar transport system substrate-binding protein
MKKRAFLTLVALLCIAAFACTSVPFLAGSADVPATTEPADTGEVQSPAENPTPEEGGEAADTPAPENFCGEQEEGTVEVRWFIGMGTGTDPVQVRAEQEVVRDFNRSQDKIKLVMEIVPYDSAKDVLSTQIASGNGPDIVGPVGWGGSNAFYGQWLDISQYIECTGFDTSVFNPALVDMYETSEGMVGLPFAVYPSVVFYNTELFDEAGLNYPPAEYDENYIMPDGSEVEWTWETLRDPASIKMQSCNTGTPGSGRPIRITGVLSGLAGRWWPTTDGPRRRRTRGWNPGAGPTTGSGAQNRSWRMRPWKAAAITAGAIPSIATGLAWSLSRSGSHAASAM